jgi:hypothetical protein
VVNVGPLCLIILIYAGVGVVVARRQPQSDRLDPARLRPALRVSSPVAVAASTLIAAALFNPLRRRVQQSVDRRFNRARYDAEHTVMVFASRLMDAVDLDTVRDDLAGVVANALEPAHVSVWSKQDNFGLSGIPHSD